MFNETKICIYVNTSKKLIIKSLGNFNWKRVKGNSCISNKLFKQAVSSITINRQVFYTSALRLVGRFTTCGA